MSRVRKYLGWTREHIDALVDALAQDADPEARAAATQDLCAAFEPLVLKLAQMYQRHAAQSVELDDLEQVGRLGVLLACRTVRRTAHDRFLAARFTAHVVWCVRHELQAFYENNHESGQVKLPQRYLRYQTRIQVATLRLSHKLKRLPTPDEIAVDLDLPPHVVVETLTHEVYTWPETWDVTRTYHANPIERLMIAKEENNNE